MADLYFDPEPLGELERLESSPAFATIFEAVDAQLSLLEEDPGSSLVRRRRFSNGLWCIIAYNDEEHWAILWEPHPVLADDVAIRYLGPATFTDP